MFDDKFVWGVASSAYQVEGTDPDDGRGKTVWDTFTEQGRIFQNQNAYTSCDHMHHYKDDYALMKNLGIKAYRFSLNWARILPEGTGRVNEKAIAMYRDMILTMKENGITPYITEDFLAFLKRLDEVKPVIVCGDLNVAHEEIDLKNPKTNRKNAGFSDEERAKMTTLLNSGFTDTFRYFYPDKEGIYSWWSYRFKAREKNAGWRIDYFITSRCLDEKLQSAGIHTEVYGSDHCPVELVADV
jgi:hypothetical protein